MSNNWSKIISDYIRAGVAIQQEIWRLRRAEAERERS